MANPIAVPGTNVPSGAAVSPGGAQGVQGTPAWTTCTSAFTIPAVGSTVSVPVVDASWITTGEMIYVDQAGGTGQSGILQVTAKAGNTLTLLNPPPAPAIPPADATQAGLLKQLSGNTTDYVGGDNACHGLIAAVATLLMPTGTIVDFGGASAPSGFLLCDGSAVSRTTYAALFTVISTGFGAGDGSTTFNVPDLRGRTAIGVGQGTGLTNRVLAVTGGEETHQLTIAELASHTHTQNAHTHGLSDAGHTHNTSFYAMGIRNDISQAIALMVPGTGTANYTGYTTGNNQQANSGLSVTSATATENNTGSGTGHNTMQPFVVVNKIIKT